MYEVCQWLPGYYASNAPRDQSNDHTASYGNWFSLRVNRIAGPRVWMAGPDLPALDPGGSRS